MELTRSPVNRKIRRISRIIETHESGNSLWSNPSFRFLMLSDCLGNLGIYFYQIALPGLVLGLSGNTASIGITILLSGVSRIGLMMVGGALSDKISPAKLLVSANLLRAALIFALIVGVALGTLSLAVLLGASLGFGMSEAIFIPARGAILPRMIPGTLLHRANTTAASLEKGIALVGPGLAGLIITAFAQAISTNGMDAHLLGAGGAFAIQFLAIGGSVILLQHVHLCAAHPADAQTAKFSTPGGSPLDLGRLICSRKNLRTFFLVVIGVNAVSTGPLCIGLPILALSRFSNGAEALGFLMSAVGCGTLLGTFLPGWLPFSRSLPIRHLLPLTAGALGAGLITLLTTQTLAMAALAAFCIGAVVGAVNVVGITQIQLNTPPEFLGRMMGLLNLK